MRWHAFLQLLLARLREFYREPEALFWVYGFPTLLAIGLGIAFASREPEPPVVDIQGTREQTEALPFLGATTVGLANSPFGCGPFLAVSALIPGRAQTEARELEAFLQFKGLTAEIHDREKCLERLSSGKTSLFIVPAAKGPRYEYDPARSESVLARYWVDALLVHRSAPNVPGPKLVPVERPGSRYIDFLLPGLMGMNLMGGGLWGVGFVIVDMRVRKLLKRLLATPMRREDFLLAILSARLVFLAPDMILLLLVGNLGFGVPIRGNPLTLALVIVVGAASFAGLGLLVASRAQKTETVSGLMNLVMLPMWLVSGVFFSSERFPAAAQPVIQALPLTQLNNALREVMLHDRGLDDVAWRLGILAAWGGVTFLLALRWFRWR